MDLLLKLNVMQHIFGWPNGLGPTRLTKIIPKGETKVAFELHSKLSQLFIDGKINGIWAHIPNEGHFSKNKNYATMHILRHMGKAAGFPDYVFLWKNNCACIELKAPNKKITSDAQKTFSTWAEKMEVPCKMFTSADESINWLVELGFVIR